MFNPLNSSLMQLSIKAKIILGFSLVLLIFFIVSLFNLQSLNRYAKSFNNYSLVSKEATSILEIDRHVSELQRTVLMYSQTGHSGGINRMKEAHTTLLQKINIIQESINDSERLDLVDRMSKILNEYDDKFESLISQRMFRDKLINYEMTTLVEQSNTLIEDLVFYSERQQNVLFGHNIGLVRQHFLHAHAEAVIFLNNRKYLHQQNAKNSIRLAKDLAYDLVNLADTEEGEILANRLAPIIIEYESNFYQAIQATRGYLYLVNVVMSGEAAEFSVLSQKLKNSTLILLDKLTTYTHYNLSNMQLITKSVTASTFLIGIILAYLIGSSIASPIKSIAYTFNALVDGKPHDDEIPGLERGDEIGVLAKAANIFKQMSEKTKTLLDETMILANELQGRETELKRQTLALEKSNQELDNFAYVASHDLKSPLRAIDNLSKWIEEDCEDILPVDSKEHLSKMRQRVSRMEKLLSDLLEYSRIGRIETYHELVDVRDVLQDIVAITDHGDHITIEISPTLPQLTAQIAPLKQVFLNLITNAIKYNDKEHGIIQITHQVLDDNFVEFIVLDNGPGIDPKYHQRIFQMFQTLESRDVIEGSGMGLAIIKKVIENQGGKISLDSDLGKGAAFMFTWPTTIV